MPSRAHSRNEDLAPLGDKGHGLEFRRTSRHHQTSRFAREKPLSPRSSQSLKFKDKGVRIENPIRPPYADLPLEFVKNADNGYSVQANYSGNQQVSKNVSSEDELIKYMSKVPGYLHKGEKIQDNLLNFGVLDWGRLEKWTHKQSQSLTSHTGTSAVKPMKGKVINPSDMATLNSVRYKKQVNYGKDKLRAIGLDLKSDKGKEMNEKQETDRKSIRDGVDLKSAKGKEKCLSKDSAYVTEIPLSKLNNHYTEVLGRSDKKPDNHDAQPKKCSDLDISSQHCSGEQESIVLLLPKDFSRPCSSEVSQKASLNRKLDQHNWGSFSDFFFVDEIHTDESFSDIPSSCSLDPTVETEKDLDKKLDKLIKAQGIELPDNPPDMAPQSDGSIMNKESSRHQVFGTGLARITRSLSFRDSSIHPPLGSMYVTAKSGPAKPEGGSGSSETSNNNKSNIHARARSSPFKRLLGPILKPKVVNQTDEHSNDLRMNPPIPVVPPELEKCEASTVKAFLHLIVKSGLPLFKFVVETNNEILASTVKCLSSFGKDEIILMYTFYSVHKVRKKSSGWKNQKVKPCGFGYNVIGQMKCKVKESVLYSVDASKSDTANCEFVTGRELAAIVVNMPDETRKYDLKNEQSTQTVVILPGGDHSQPHEGVPSSLINRWRTGGLCDCGGWDEGCKLRILSYLEDQKGLIHSRSGLMDFRCDLYDQGESKEMSPVFRLVPFRDGLFSVEFDAKMSSLQAFSICVAVINSKQPRISSVESKPASFASGEGPEIHPPVSPVGRV